MSPRPVEPATWWYIGSTTSRSPKRRFTDAEEQRHVLNELDRLGVDPTGREADGYHHAELFVLHPADEQLTTPLHELVGPPPP